LLYIYSNKPHDILLECVKITLNDIKFEFVLGNKTEDKPKPHPDSINKYIKEHNINKKDVVYVGDSPVDLRFAQNLEVDSIILTHGYWNEGNIKDANPTFFADNLRDILTYIK
jgi:phosphoglycolate phosphatase